MSVLTTFNFMNRKLNKGYCAPAPLNINFVSGQPYRAVGASDYFAIATRYCTKRFEWRGYDLNTAKRIQAFYVAGNEYRSGYCRMQRKYWWDGYRLQHRSEWKNQNSVQVASIGGEMYKVEVTVDEEDQFGLRYYPDDYSKMPSTFDWWCGLFSAAYDDVDWAHYSTLHVDPVTKRTAPYVFEEFYDEPFTLFD